MNKDKLKIFVCAAKPFDESVVPEECHEILYNNFENELSPLDIYYAEFRHIYEICNNIDLSNLDYVGICQYRKYYDASINTILNVFNNDINAVIVAEKLRFKFSNFDLYNRVFYIKQLIDLKEIIKNYFSEYILSFERVMNRTYLYPYNMCIMSKDNYIKYCNWIYDIMIKFNELYNFKTDDDVTKYVNENKNNISNMVNPLAPEYFKSVWYNMRIGGHIIERLTNVYIEHNFNNIYEIPVKIIS